MSLSLPLDYSLEFPYCFLMPFSGKSRFERTPNVPQNRPFSVARNGLQGHFFSSQK